MSRTDDIPAARIAEWRARLRGHGIGDGDLDRLERTLREQVSRLVAAGLDPDEAFLIAVKRTAGLSVAAREFNQAHAGWLWRQLAARPVAGIGQLPLRGDLVLAAALALAAAAAVKAPALFGAQFDTASGGFYARNLGLLVLPLLAALLLGRHGVTPARSVTFGVLFAAGAVFANVFPFLPGGATESLTAIHLPIALWLVVGLAHAGNGWRTASGRMEFVRFSGEWLIYYVLFALGGGVLALLTAALFHAVGVGIDGFLEQWLLPCGAAGAVIVAGWLADGKNGVAGQLAPLLAQVFTPLFAALLVAFLAVMVWTGAGIAVDREVLIAFDLLLVLVVGMLLYAISARDQEAPRNVFDTLRLVLAVAALVADLAALAAVAARIGEFGFSANKVAALAVNLLLLAHLAGTAWLHVRLLAGTGSFAAVARWQTAYLPVYGVWAALVVVLFPPLFRYL
ncbi:MAG: hypothetical protein OXJ62_11875 [Spirochaetaceae bacterium]|nr:hypothetical protein [Spirochaetaceae bacterium]